MGLSDVFRHQGYLSVNRSRQDHFIWMGIPLRGKVVFETGAGIGDHTLFLLDQGATRVYVNEARHESVAFLRQRFGHDLRIKLLPGNLETCLGEPEFQIQVDLVYCYGTLYHLANPDEVLSALARIGKTIALELLTGVPAAHGPCAEGSADPSQSFSGQGSRPLPQEVIAWLKASYPFVYAPAQACPGGRSVYVGSYCGVESAKLLRL